MPKTKIAKLVRTVKSPATTGSRIKPKSIDVKPPAAEPPLPAAFENKAGRYELIRIDNGQAYYSFTNRYQKTVDATMPVIMWRKMQERAFKETA